MHHVASNSLRLCISASGLLAFICNLQVQAEPPYASLIGDTVHLHPSGATFTIPDKWLQRGVDSANKLYVSRMELQDVEKTGSGTWGADYAEVVNSVLPSKTCVLHAGGEFSELQMRVYLGNWSPDQLQELTRDKGLATAKKISNDPEMKVAKIKEDTIGEWRRTTISFSVWHYDVIYTANAAFYSRKLEAASVVLVFMYPSGSREQGLIEPIVSSFKHP